MVSSAAAAYPFPSNKSRFSVGTPRGLGSWPEERGAGLVCLVCLVYLVCLVESAKGRTGEKGETGEMVCRVCLVGLTENLTRGT